MNGFHPTWQLKRWVLLAMLAGVLLLLGTSCATTRHREPAHVQAEYSEDTAARLHQPYDDKRIAREEPWPSRVR